MNPVLRGTIPVLCGGMLIFCAGCDRLVIEDAASDTGEAPARARSVEPKGAPPRPKTVRANLPEYPFVRKITDSQGRKLEAKILGKQDGKIAFLRTSDEKHFIVPIEQLGEEDRGFFSRMPEGKHIPVAEESSRSATTLGGRRRAEWFTDVDAAEDRARADKLPVFMLFTGSSWCPPCIKLEQNVFSTFEFKDFADKNMILLKLDIPKGSNAHAELREEYGITSYPTFYLTEVDGEDLGAEVGYRGEKVGTYIKKLKAMME